MESADPVEARARGRVGQTLRGKYRLERVLGVGGMAAVYAAVHRNGRPVAVKLLHPELALHEVIRDRFLREGQVANAVGHPGAVAVLDDDLAEDGAAFLVMELLDGSTVESLSEVARLPLAAVCSVGLQLLDVLEAAHARGVVHRDIKPANLFVTRDGSLKVLDFGIARLREPGSASATQTGLMLGTPAFMAPEQALGKMSLVDGRTDLWAVGATLFTLISGQSVHSASTVQEALVKAATAPAPSLARVAPATPPWLSSVVDRALAFEPDARFASATEMRLALAAHAVDATTAALASLVTTPAVPVARAPVAKVATEVAVVTAAPGEKRSASRVAIAAAMTLGVVAIGFGLWSREPVPEPAPAASVPATLASTPASAQRPRLETAPTTNLAPSAETSVSPAPAPLPPRIATRRPAPAATSAAASPPPAPATRPNCTPPYRLDASGMKVWKRECF